MINFSLNELKLIAKSRRTKGYKNMPRERLLNALNESESVQSENNFDNARIRKIDRSIYEDYYKPIRTSSAFNSNYIEYESKGGKDKVLSTKEYLIITRPYLSDIIMEIQ